MSCYNFEEINYKEGFLDSSVDATYILHLEGNGRLESIRKQLEEFQPTKTVYIIFNKGYKKCKKVLSKQEPPIDLIDAFLQAFKHAKDKNYKNILILEDDFIFSKKIKNKDVYTDVNNFINKQKGKNFMYMLGALPHLQMPYENKHYKLFSSSGTHACIYSKELIDHLLSNVDFSNIIDWDVFTNLNIRRYIYIESLCYQLFPQTENNNYWFHGYGTVHILKKYLIILKVDKFVEPGYTIAYFISKLWIYILIFIILLIIYSFLIKK